MPNSARSPPLQNDRPLPVSTTSVIDGSRRATSSASSSAARMSVENALCRCGRLNRTCRRSPSRSACTGSGMSGTVAGPRSASQRANSGPDCSVEYASDSVMTPARVGPAGSIERSTSSQTAAACGQRWHRSVSSASASDTDATVMARRSSVSSSVSVKVASSEGDPTAMTTPPASSVTSTSLSAPACTACRYRCAAVAPRTRSTADTCSAPTGLAASPAVPRRTRRWRRRDRSSARRP